jgi:PAS domain-containing protein
VSPPGAAAPLGAAVLDAAGSIALANEAFARLAGSNVGYLLGRPFFEEFGAVEAIREAGRAYLAPRGSLDGEVAVTAFGAARGDFRIRMRSLAAPTGRFALVLVEEAPAPERPAAGPPAPGGGEPDAGSSARHEINNSLMAVFGHLEILLAQPDTPEPIRRRVETLLRETAKIRDRLAELKAAQSK